MKSESKVGILALTLAIISIHQAPAAAATIDLGQFITNPSFEAPVTSCCSLPTGWFQGGTAIGDAGNWTPIDFPAAGLSAQAGAQVGYINSYSGQADFANYWYLAQTLPVILTPGDTYGLTYAVARRADASDAGAFRVQINGNVVACGTCYAMTTGYTGAFAPGTWSLETVFYTAQTADAGTSPTIYLVNDGRVGGQGFAQVEFDLAPTPTVDTTEAATAVPEPGTFALCGSMLLAAGLIGRRRFFTS